MLNFLIFQSFFQVYVEELCTADLGGTANRRRQELCRSIPPETVHGSDTSVAEFGNLGSDFNNINRWLKAVVLNPNCFGTRIFHTKISTTRNWGPSVQFFIYLVTWSRKKVEPATRLKSATTRYRVATRRLRNAALDHITWVQGPKVPLLTFVRKFGQSWTFRFFLQPKRQLETLTK